MIPLKSVHLFQIRTSVALSKIQAPLARDESGPTPQVWPPGSRPVFGSRFCSSNLSQQAESTPPEIWQSLGAELDFEHSSGSSGAFAAGIWGDTGPDSALAHPRGKPVPVRSGSGPGHLAPDSELRPRVLLQPHLSCITDLSECCKRGVWGGV